MGTVTGRISYYRGWRFVAGSNSYRATKGRAVLRFFLVAADE
jgi:hypothetical protein